MEASERITGSKGIRELFKKVLKEDLGSGDVTTRLIVPEELSLCGKLIAKEEGIIAGMDAVKEIFTVFNDDTVVSPLSADGDRVFCDQVIAEINGPARTILSAERTALNILQRMSGIATETGKFVEAVKGTKAVILDTRKTAPGLRILDKLAVKTGGGQNHRFGLYDMVLIKENHITAAGSITEAVSRVRSGIPRGMKVEVEVGTLDELREALQLRVDRILLDNMDIEQMKQAVGITAGRVPLEASGNIILSRAKEIADAGLDFISVGSLTHSVSALDISLLLNNPESPV